MTLPMARELGQHGIRVVSIAPGIFDTPMMQTVSPDVRTSLESQIPSLSGSVSRVNLHN